jgi:hypothetical protein
VNDHISLENSSPGLYNKKKGNGKLWFTRTGAVAPKGFPLGGSWQKSLIFD